MNRSINVRFHSYFIQTYTDSTKTCLKLYIKSIKPMTGER